MIIVDKARGPSRHKPWHTFIVSYQVLFINSHLLDYERSQGVTPTPHPRYTRLGFPLRWCFRNNNLSSSSAVEIWGLSRQQHPPQQQQQQYVTGGNWNRFLIATLRRTNSSEPGDQFRLHREEANGALWNIWHVIKYIFMVRGWFFS